MLRVLAILLRGRDLDHSRTLLPPQMFRDVNKAFLEHESRRPHFLAQNLLKKVINEPTQITANANIGFSRIIRLSLKNPPK